MGIKKSDLLYENEYSWTTYEDDDPKVTGVPDSTELNRNEGYEILHFINRLMDKNDLKKIATANKIEKMIRNDVPKNIHSHSKISKWIIDNWNK